MHIERVTDSFSIDVTPDPSLLLPGSATASHIRQTIDGLELLGARINSSSRLHQYAAMFDDADDASSVAFDNALLESSQFSAIRRALAQLPAPAEWLALVNTATEGRRFAAEDHPGCRARSTQFELFVMANLACAGFNVAAAPQDIKAQIGSAQLAFAAKRLRSLKKLRDNLSDGCHQIFTHKTPGFVVVDLSFVNAFTKPVYVQCLEHQQFLAASVLDGYAMEHKRLIFRAAERPGVLGVLLHASVIGRSLSPVARFVSRRWVLCANQHSESGGLLIAALQKLGQAPPANS